MFGDFCQFITTLIEYTDRLRYIYITLCVVNALSAIFSTVFNFLVLLVIKRSSSLHTPSYVLLSALAFSDFAVGCIVQPLYIAFRVADITGASTVYCGFGIAYDLIANIFGGISFLTITSISFDRFLALYLRQRYRVVVTQKRALVLTLVNGIIAVIYGLTGMLNRKAYYVLGIILGPLFLVIASLNFVNINRLVRRHQRRNFRLTSQHTRGGTPKSGIDNRRLFKTLLYVFLVFLLCYLPYIFCALALKTTSRNDALQITVHVTVTIVFINSSLNPVLYCWRIAEIRKAVKQIMCRDKRHVLDSVNTTEVGSSDSGVTGVSYRVK